MPTTKLSAISTNRDYMVYTLGRYVKRAEESNKKLAENIVKYGICDRLGWLKEPLQEDALGKTAQKVLNTLEAGESLQNVRDGLAERIQKELGYICLGNSDNDAKIMLLQAMQRVLADVEYGMKPDKSEA